MVTLTKEESTKLYEFIMNYLEDTNYSYPKHRYERLRILGLEHIVDKLKQESDDD